MSLGKQFSSWSNAKKYGAALYYLSHAHMGPITEAQWSRLNALQMQIAYGAFSETGPLPEFVLCSVQEKKKREEDWKSVSRTPKHIAMRQFLDIMDNLFPNWFKTRAIFEDYDFEWSQTPSPHLSIPSSSRVSLSEVPSHASLEKPSILRSPKVLKEHRSVGTFSTALHQLHDYEAKKMLSTSPKLPKLNACRDVASTVSRLKGDYDHSRERELKVINSKYYKQHRSASRTELDETDNRSKEKLSELYQTLTSGRVTTEREREFMHQLEDGLTSQSETAMTILTRRLQSSHCMPSLPSSVSFPGTSSAQLEAILRPWFELQCQLLSDLEKVLAQELGEKAEMLGTIQKELLKAVNFVFSFARQAEKRCWDLESKLEGLDFEYDTQCVTLAAMAELYNRSNWDIDAASCPKLAKSEYQLQISRGITVLKGESGAALRKVEENMRVLSQNFSVMQRRLIEHTMEHDKLADCIRLLQASAELMHGQVCDPAPDLGRNEAFEVQLAAAAAAAEDQKDSSGRESGEGRKTEDSVEEVVQTE